MQTNKLDLKVLVCYTGVFRHDDNWWRRIALAFHYLKHHGIKNNSSIRAYYITKDGVAYTQDIKHTLEADNTVYTGGFSSFYCDKIGHSIDFLPKNLEIFEVLEGLRKRKSRVACTYKNYLVFDADSLQTIMDTKPKSKSAITTFKITEIGGVFGEDVTDAGVSISAKNDSYIRDILLYDYDMTVGVIPPHLENVLRELVTFQRITKLIENLDVLPIIVSQTARVIKDLANLCEHLNRVGPYYIHVSGNHSNGKQHILDLIALFKNNTKGNRQLDNEKLSDIYYQFQETNKIRALSDRDIVYCKELESLESEVMFSILKLNELILKNNKSSGIILESTMSKKDLYNQGALPPDFMDLLLDSCALDLQSFATRTADKLLFFFFEWIKKLGKDWNTFKPSWGLVYAIWSGDWKYGENDLKRTLNTVLDDNLDNNPNIITEEKIPDFYTFDSKTDNLSSDNLKILKITAIISVIGAIKRINLYYQKHHHKTLIIEQDLFNLACNFLNLAPNQVRPWFDCAEISRSDLY